MNYNKLKMILNSVEILYCEAVSKDPDFFKKLDEFETIKFILDKVKEFQIKKPFT